MAPAPAPKPNRSTGPRTQPGKAASSQNSLRHGLASGVLLIPGEDEADWKALLTGLLSEWAPTTPTEQILVENLAKHHWLVERAIRLQGETLAAVPDPTNLPASFAVLLRYQTTNERAFARALKALQDLRKSAQQFVSQKERAARNDAEADVFALLSRPLPKMDLAAELERIRSGRPLVPPPSWTPNSCGPK